MVIEVLVTNIDIKLNIAGSKYGFPILWSN